VKTRLVQVSVTAEHIRSGVRAGCWDCPVALAIAERLEPATLNGEWRGGSGFAVSVLDEDVAVILDGMGSRVKGCRRILLPRAASDFIGLFDAGCVGLEPFSFPLRLPIDCLREGS